MCLKGTVSVVQRTPTAAAFWTSRCLETASAEWTARVPLATERRKSAISDQDTARAAPRDLITGNKKERMELERN